MAGKQNRYVEEAFRFSGTVIVVLAVLGQRFMGHVMEENRAQWVREILFLEILAGVLQNIWKSNLDAKVNSQ